jgi:hypothetical protein
MGPPPGVPPGGGGGGGGHLMGYAGKNAEADNSSVITGFVIK